MKIHSNTKKMKYLNRNTQILFVLFLIVSCSSAKITQQSNLNDRNVEFILEGTNSPTIVFETGMGQTIKTWNTILDSLSKHTQIYAYNRPGYGRSKIMNQPKTVIEVAEQLRVNLYEQNIKPPYILVGHSAGGLYINMFARLYPEEVVGVVFLDASHPEQFEYFKHHHTFLYNILITATKNRNCKYEYDIVTSTLTSFTNAPEFPDIPVTVLTAGKKSSPLETKKLKEKWFYFQDDLARLSNNSKHIIVEDSGHYIHKNNPEIVISEILRIISNNNY